MEDKPDRYLLYGKVVVPVQDLEEWYSKLTDEMRRIDFSSIVDKSGEIVHISTVFLGIDYNYGGGDPILFETMIFYGPHDGYQRRYHTYDEAENGHKQILNMVLNS